MDRDSNCCANNKDRNVPLASGEQAGEQRSPGSCFVPASRRLRSEPRSAVTGRPAGVRPRAQMAPGQGSHPWKSAGGICVLRTGLPPGCPAARSLPREGLRFCLKGPRVPGTGALLPYPGRPLPLAAFSILVLRMRLSSGALAKRWIIIKC